MQSNITRTPRQCGIYSATNTINRKRLYGSSNDVYGRTNLHASLLRRQKHRNPHLQAAHNKYGADSFFWRFELAVHEPFLRWVEQIYLNENTEGYNIARVAVAPFCGRKHTSEARERIGAARRGKPGRKQSDASNEKNRQAHIGRKHGPQAKAKLSAFFKGRKCKPMPVWLKEKLRSINRGSKASAETRAKLSAIRKGRRPAEVTLTKMREVRSRLLCETGPGSLRETLRIAQLNVWLKRGARGYSERDNSFRVQCMGQTATVKTEEEAIALVAELRNRGTS